MDPNVMNNMMSMFADPDLLQSMEKMMTNEKIQEIMNNKELMGNVMNMFKNPSTSQAQDNSPIETITDTTNPEPEPITAADSDSLSENDNVELVDLKNETYNNRHGVIVNYNADKDRYMVRLDDNVSILVKSINIRKQTEVDATEAVEDNVVIVD